MQREPPRKGGGSGLFPAPLAFESKLEKEEDVLDAMLMAHARGQLPPETWDKLHKAAQRDERLSELAFAYESVSQGKRLKTLSGAPVAEFLFQAGRFFGDVFGDEFGAATYLERALTAMTTHTPAFEKLDVLLTKAKNWKRLGELTAEFAQHGARADQIALLRRAAELLEKAEAGDDKLIELYQQILRLEPSDENARNQLEARYLKANRVRDVARLLEQALSVDPPPASRVARKLHGRLLELYANTLHEPERSIPHVEALLEDDPSHDEARKVAQKLVVIKGLAARAAAALSKACAAVGTPAEVARFLQIELEHTRGPKRRDVLHRIGVLKQERLNDEKGAFESFEQALALDANDDELRSRYVALAGKLGKPLDAAKTLMRIGPALKDPTLRSKVSAELGQLFLEGGDMKRAKATFVSVLAAPDAGPPATLAAAHALAGIYTKENDTKALADVLERIGQVESDEERARLANEQLAELAAQLGDTPRAIAAYKRLLHTSSRGRALAALAPLFEASGDANDLALILEERAKDAKTPAEARTLAFRAAEVRTTKTPDVAAASDAWKNLVASFGPARDAYAFWIPLLETQREWEDLAEALRADGSLASEAERGEIFARLGNVLLTRLHDVPAAIDAFQRSLVIDVSEDAATVAGGQHLKAARATLEKLAAAGEQRLAAAAVLEPIYRAERNTAALLRLLDTKGQLVAEADGRLAALEEATQLATSIDQGRAIDFAGRGLTEAVASTRPLEPWLERIDRLTGPGVDPKRRAGILVAALGDRAIDLQRARLARRAGEALGRAGDIPGALAVYRRALAFEPSSAELMSLIDDLLRDQGSPTERVALYRTALDRSSDPQRRKDLLHRIGRIEKSDLHDLAAARATYGAALTEDPDDAEGHAALVEIFTELALWQELCDLLEARLLRATGEEGRRTRAQLAEVAAAHGQTERGLEQCRMLMLDEALGEEELSKVERIAETLSDFAMTRDVLKRRAATADSRDQVRFLERLGEVESDHLNDLDAAAASWNHAAKIAEGVGDDERARHLYARVRKVAPEDHDAAARLLELYERAEQWAPLPALYGVLLEHARGREEKVELLLRVAAIHAERLGDLAAASTSAARAFDLAPNDRNVLATFERLSVRAGSSAEFETAIDEALTRSARGEDEVAQRAEMRLAKARVLAADPKRQDDAAGSYRELLDDANIDGTTLETSLTAFEVLLESDPEARRADRRWLLAWRAEHTKEADRVPALLAWAAAEETTFADPVRALELYRRALSTDAENEGALSAAARLALSLGDTEGALAALVARRDRSEGLSRNVLDLEIAGVLLDRTSRFEEALASVKSVLESTPQDQTALALAGRLLAGPSTRTQAVAMLVEACEHAEDGDVRAQIVSCLLDSPATPLASDLRRGWYERLLQLYHSQGKLELALATVVRAAAELPPASALWDSAEALARELKRPDEVATLYQTVLAQSLAQDQGVALGERAVAFYEEWFEDSGRVVGILERVLEIDPAAQWAFDRLKLLFDAAERWDDLFALFDRALPAADTAKKIELLEDAAEVAKNFADKPDRAIGYLEQLSKWKPNDARLAASLERLYERQGRHRELIGLLAARVPSLPPKEAQKTRARVAALWIGELADPAAALAQVEEMLAQGEGDVDATEALALLEKILAAAPTVEATRESIAPPSRSKRGGRRESVAPKRISVRQRAAALLKERYSEAGREGDLVRILEIELEAIKSAKERIRRHHQIATLYASLGNEVAAMEQYIALVTLEPDVASHRVRLAELAERVGRFDRFADVLASAADDCTDDTLRVELLMQAGVVQADRVGDGDRAIDLFMRILAISSVGAPLVLAAARRVEPLLAAGRRPTERLQVLERIAAIEPDASTRRDVLGMAARLATELAEQGDASAAEGSPRDAMNARAIAAWESRLAEDSEDMGALDGLASLLEHEKHYERLIEVLRRRASAPVDVEQKRADRVRIADLYANQRGDEVAAIAAWREVEAEFGETDESTRALAGLLRAASRFEDLAGLLERGAARATEPLGRAEFLRELGDVQKEQIGDGARALESYAEALADDVHNEGARTGVRSLLDEETRRARAVSVLMNTYQATDAWQLILDLTEHRLLAAPDDASKLDILRDAARLAETRANDAPRAFEAMKRALTLAPEDAVVEAETARLADATDGLRSLVETYAEVIEQGEGKRDAKLLAHLRFEMGRLLEERLSDERGALAAYLRIVEGAPSSLDAATAAARVAGSLGRWDAVAKLLADVSRCAGRVEPQLVEAIEQAATRASSWDALSSAVLPLLEPEGSARADLPPGVARDLEAQLAAWHRDKRGDPDAAEAALQRALAHDALNAGILASLTQVQRRTKGRPLVESLLRLSQATGGDLELLREAAEIAQSSIGDRPLAKTILERLLAQATLRWVGAEGDAEPGAGVSLGAPGAPAPLVEWALEELVRIHEEEAEYARVVDVLVATSKLPFKRDVRRALRHRAAAVAFDRLADTDRGITLYLALFDDDPEDELAIERLVALYRTSGRPSELLTLRERQIATATTPERRIDLRLEAARILDALGDYDGALKVLRQSLTEAPRHEATIAGLAKILEARGRHRELCELMTHQAALAEAAGEVTSAADLWWRAASVAEESLGDRAAATEHHECVVALEPRPRSFDALARLASERRDHATAARYLGLLKDVSTKPERAQITIRLAEALLASDRSDLAEAALEEACDEEPSSDDLRTRLVRLYRQGESWQKLARLLTVAAAHAPDKAARLTRLREAAVLLTTKCGAPDEAIPLLEQASDLEPGEQSIRLALAAAFVAAKREAEGRALLRALIDGFGTRRPKERAPVHYHLAQLELAMGNRARALVELDAATRIDPANPEILRTLAELARDDGQLERAERSYRALLVVLRRNEDAPVASTTDPTSIIARSEVLLELSAIASRQGEDDRAQEILESALEAATRTVLEEERLEDALRARGDFATLVRALEAKLARIGDGDDAARPLAQLAEIFDEKLARLEEALPLRLRVVALDPGGSASHDAALALARRIEGGADRYVESVRALAENAVDAGDRVLACALMLRLGAVLEADSKDDVRAAATYERALELAERVPDVLYALDRVYERLGDSAAQDRVLAKRIAALESEGGGAGASDALYRLAALRLLSQSTIEQGCDLLASALERDPELDRAEAALKRAVESFPKHVRLLELYERVGRAPGHERALVDALTRRAALPGAASETFREAVEVATRLGDNALAESLLTRFIEGEQSAQQNVSNLAWALAVLAQIREAQGDVRQAVTLKKSAASLAEPETSRKLSFEVAKLAEGALVDLALAAETYESLRERDPADREAWEPLLDVYRRMKKSDRLAALLASVVDFVDDGVERSRLRLERVKVMMEDLGLGDEAAGPLREIVDEDPSQIEAAMMLANILERKNDHDALADLLAKQIDAAKDRSDGSSVASLALRLGALLEKRDAVTARNVYFTGLDWEPQSREILRALLGLFEHGAEAADRADIMERLLAIEEGPRAEELALSLHALRVDQWDDLAAERALELGVKAHPSSFVLKQRLETTYRDRKAWLKLADLFVLDAGARADAGQRVERLREAAQIHHAQLKDAKAAAVVLKKAHDARPEDVDLLAELVSMLSEAGDAAAAINELTLAIDGLAADSASRAPLLAQRASLRSTLGDDANALSDLESAFVLNEGKYISAFAAQLDRSCASSARAGDAKTARELRLRLVQILPKTGDVEGARVMLAELIKQDPKDKGALRALAGIEEEAEKWDAASAAYRRLVALEEGDAVVDIALRLADACERGSRVGDARGGLERARMVAPGNDALRQRLEKLYEHTGAFRELADMYLDDARATGDVAGRFAQLVKAGSLLLRQAGDAEAAIASLREAHALRPGDHECISLLSDAHIDLGRTVEAAELLNAAIASHKGRRSRELASLYHRIARVSRADGEQTSELGYLTQSMDMDSQNGVVAAELATLAMDHGQLDLANRALRVVTMLRAPGPMSKALAYQYMGEIARKQGDVKRALMLLKRAVQEDPSLSGARALIEHLQAQ